MKGNIPPKTNKPESNDADRRDDENDVDRNHTVSEQPRPWTSSATHALGRFGWRLIREDDTPNPSAAE